MVDLVRLQCWQAGSGDAAFCVVGARPGGSRGGRAPWGCRPRVLCGAADYAVCRAGWSITSFGSVRRVSRAVASDVVELTHFRGHLVDAV